MKTWVIRNKETGEPITETTDKGMIDFLNAEKYEAIPVLQHLQELNIPDSKARQWSEGVRS